MKKWTAVLIIIMTSLSLAFFAYGAAESGENGRAEPQPLEMPVPGEELLGAWYCMHDGVPVCLDLEEDGAYTLSIAGIETKGPWEMTDGSIVPDGDADAAMAVINNERILWSETGEVFTREEAAPFEPAPVAEEGVEISMFDGYWVSNYVETEGQRLPSGVLGDNSELFIDNGRVAMGGSVFGDIILDFSFQDGALTYENSEALVTLQIQNDLNLRCTVTGADSEFIIYLIRGDFESLPVFTAQEAEE